MNINKWIIRNGFTELRLSCSSIKRDTAAYTVVLGEAFFTYLALLYGIK